MGARRAGEPPGPPGRSTEGSVPQNQIAERRALSFAPGRRPSRVARPGLTEFGGTRPAEAPERR